MIELTATQKVRLMLTGYPNTEPNFQHEGPTVTRWITGGPEPTAYVRFQRQSRHILTYCPQCGKELGEFDANYGSNTYQELEKIRANSIEHQRQHETSYRSNNIARPD